MVNMKVMVPTRGIIGGLIFTACFVCYMLRVNMSINIIAMISPKETANTIELNGTSSQCIPRANVNITTIDPNHTRDFGNRYEWDSKVEALILGSYFWGYIITSIPGGLLAELFGPTKTIAISLSLSSILTILIPFAASMHYYAVIAIRFLLGLLAGVVFPALHCLVSHWAPPNEKGKFIGALLGGTLGTVLTWPLLGLVIENWGWTWAFYVPGVIGALWVCAWISFATDTPDKNRYISEVEKAYINMSLGNRSNAPKAFPPYCRIALSAPFWALTVLHFGNLWGLYFLMTEGPKYMAKALGFELGHSGVLAALPYLARLIAGFIFGYIGDQIRTKKCMSVTAIRKTFVVFSHIIPGGLMLAQLLVGCNAALSVALLTISLGLNGAATLTNLQNPQDLAPNFAGTLYGLANCIGSTSGFISPMVTSHFTAEGNGIEQWRMVFIIGATIYIICAIVFIFVGSGGEQPWNEIASKEMQGAENAAFESPALGIETKTVENTKI